MVFGGSQENALDYLCCSAAAMGPGTGHIVYFGWIHSHSAGGRPNHGDHPRSSGTQDCVAIPRDVRTNDIRSDDRISSRPSAVVPAGTHPEHGGQGAFRLVDDAHKRNPVFFATLTDARLARFSVSTRAHTPQVFAHEIRCSPRYALPSPRRRRTR